MTFTQRPTSQPANGRTAAQMPVVSPRNYPAVALGTAQERARNIASTVGFLRESGYPVGRVILVSDQGEGKSSATGRNLQVALPDTPVSQFGLERFERLPLRSVDMVVVEASATSGSELAKVREALGNSVGGVFKGMFEGNRSTQLVEVGKPIGRIIAPNTSLGSQR